VKPTPLVLIVEDDRVTNTAIRDLFADDAIATLTATSLREARNYIRTRNVVGVVLDYALPDGTADELLNDLAHATHPPGVVIASANPSAMEIAKRFGIGCIRKPLDLEALLETVRGFIAADAAPVA